MKARLIKMNERLTTHDISGLRGELIFGTGRHFVDYTDPFGNKTKIAKFDEILSRDHNIIPIGGYQYVFGKLFNIGLDQESTLRVGVLNDESPMMRIGVEPGRGKYSDYNAECNDGTALEPVLPNTGVNLPAKHCIFGFMVGDGGAKEDNITPIAPDYKNRTLYHAIPFRMNNDSYPFPEGTYYGKDQQQTNDYDHYGYYIKKFSNPQPHIVHMYASDNDSEMEIVDDSVFSSTSSTPIESFVEMNIDISAYDCRGYFTTTGTTPRINEFGLVAGWYCKDDTKGIDDYENLVLMTHFTRSSIPLADGDKVEAIYRIYAR